MIKKEIDVYASPVFKVVDLLSPNLMFRSDADLLLDLVTKGDSESADIDFSDMNR